MASKEKHLVVDEGKDHAYYMYGASGAGMLAVIETGTRGEDGTYIETGTSEDESALQIGFAAGLSFAAVASTLF